MRADELAAPLCRALASEMREVGALVEALAELLAADDTVAGRYLDQLQGFDLIAQQLGESAALLERLAGGDCLQLAVEQVRLERMKMRLRTVLRPAT